MEENEEVVKYVIGQDPGGTTGVACLKYTDTTLPELIYLHQIEDGKVGYKEFFRGSEVRDNLDYVSEKWVERNTKGADRTPLVIEGVQYAFWDDEVTYQNPDQKKLVSDDWLKEQNLWTPGKRHQMDALIHAIVFLRNNDHKPTQEALAGEKDEKIAEEGEAGGKQLDENVSHDPNQASGDEVTESLIEQVMRAMQEAEDADGGGDGDGDGEGEDGEASESASQAPGEHGVDSSDNSMPGGVGRDTSDEGSKKRREIGGSFIGYDTIGSDEVSTVLYED